MDETSNSYTFTYDDTNLLNQMDAQHLKLVEQLTQLNATLDFVDTASASIVTYAVVLIPLAGIIGFGWWFALQFLTRHK